MSGDGTDGETGHDAGRRPDQAGAPAPGQSYGQAAPQSYGQPPPQSYDQSYGQSHGQAPPPYGQQQPYGQQPPGQPYGPPGAGPWGPPVAKPGVIPLRQLTLGDIYGGAFATLRRNPGASIGLAFAVSAVFMALPLLGSVLYGAAGGAAVDPLALGAFGGGGDLGFAVLNNAGTVFNAVATLVITGLMTRVVGSAVVGRPMRAGEAWARTKGRLWALLGLSLLSALVLVLLVGVPAAIGFGLGLAAGSEGLALGLALLFLLLGLVAAAFVWTRYLLLATPALVLEGAGVLASVRRAGQLSRQQFWRLLGIALLANIMVAVAAQVVAIPLGIVGGLALVLVGGSWGTAVLLLVTNLATLLSAALVSPFVAGVVTLQYVDQRFRKEGLDIALLESSLGDRPA